MADKRKYVVSIRRTYIHGAFIEVEAESVEEAEAWALENMGNYDMRIIDMKPEEDFAEAQYDNDDHKDQWITK